MTRMQVLVGRGTQTDIRTFPHAELGNVSLIVKRAGALHAIFLLILYASDYTSKQAFNDTKSHFVHSINTRSNPGYVCSLRGLF